ncbi:flagellar filament capping protein FliD [Citromicrobium bathyomarinum]|uniref:flagellar filament capping protein FliD n=1 Tax=Citromicrobium bathyomarinum TaxID=72174 RepID=UPI00315AF006
METTAPSTSSIVSRLGGGSGVDMVALAEDLARAQFENRQVRLEDRSEVLEQKISAASRLRGLLSSFASALGDRVRTGDLSAQPNIGNASVAKVSSPLGTSGKGTYSLEVSQLAQSQTLLSPDYAADEGVGSGTLTLRFGTISGTAFTADPDQGAVDIAIAPDATLADVASAINAKGTSVTAYVADSANGSQLVLKGAQGAQNGFVIEATEDNPGNIITGPRGLELLAWKPQDGDPALLTSTAQNAEYTLDGVDRSSSSNKINNVAPGLSLELTGTTAPGAPTTIGFGSPKNAVTSAMTDIVGALNEIANELNAATDAMTGELARDYGARALRSEFSSLGTKVIMPNAPEGAPRTLAEIGLAIERNGTFRLDTARLDKALTETPDAVAAMFTSGINGVFSTIDRIARHNAIATDPGSLAGSVARYTSQSEQIGDDLAELAEKQEALRAQMVARFSQSDARVSASQSTLSFLQSQIEAWNSQRN